MLAEISDLKVVSADNYNSSGNDIQVVFTDKTKVFVTGAWFNTVRCMFYCYFPVCSYVLTFVVLVVVCFFWSI